MNFDDLARLCDEYVVIEEIVINKENKKVVDQTEINNVRFANLWANASITKDKKAFNSRSRQTYEYFVSKVKEQLDQNADWDIKGLKLGTSLLIPKSLYPREILNNLFYDEVSTRIVEEFINQNFDVKNSIKSKWKQARASLRTQNYKKFSFKDLKEYYETYEVEDGVYQNKTNGKVIIDDVKKIRIAFAMLWHKAAKTKNLAADKDYYVYCADAADTYDGLKEKVKLSIDGQNEFHYMTLVRNMEAVIAAYPDAAMILKRLFQTEMDAQITYDYFSTLDPTIKDVKTLIETSDTVNLIHKQKVRG